MAVAVLVPTYNEEEGIGSVLDRIARLKKKDWHVYVVDSCSTDNTVKIAKRKGAKVIALPIRGKGIAIREAFSRINEEIAITLDGDNTYAPEDLPSVVAALSDCEVAVGSRLKGDMANGAMSKLNYFGNLFLSFAASQFYWRGISDLCSGMWAFRRSAYKRMSITARHFDVEANYFVECAKGDMRFCEVPISYGTRLGTTKTGISPIVGIRIFLFLLIGLIG
jgi:dolichol-phosphate mannosyltransferase